MSPSRSEVTLWYHLELREPREMLRDNWRRFEVPRSCIAGSDEKCSYLTSSLGFDAALNYKAPDFSEKFQVATEQLIDIFFDNVGGEVLDLALAKAKPHAKFVTCGGISKYNNDTPQGPKNYLEIVRMRIKTEGFIVLDYQERRKDARTSLAQWLDKGKLQTTETVVKGGLAEADKALVALYEGFNTGRTLCLD